MPHGVSQTERRKAGSVSWERENKKISRVACMLVSARRVKAERASARARERASETETVELGFFFTPEFN